jgi:glucosamine--fructose-6-phosphate aminotransferase (isomerizing)
MCGIVGYIGNRQAYDILIKGKVIAIVTEGDKTVRELADHIISIPQTEECLYPILTSIPLQLLAYHIAVVKGCDVDQPRNLAKSVTVE